MPTADDVAHAIVAAARLCSVDAEAIVGAKQPSPGDALRTARARCYAAMALDTVFNRTKPKTKHAGYPVSRAAIARMVGAPRASQDGMVHALRSKLLDKRKIAWWRVSIAEGVIAAVLAACGEAAPSRTVEDAPEPPKAAPRPPQGETAIREPSPVLRVMPLTVLKGPAIVTRDGVVVDVAKATVTRFGHTVSFADDIDALGVVACLVKVMPAVLPFDRVAQNVWGHMQDCHYRVAAAADRANHRLEPTALRIRTVPKLGVAISEV